MRVKLHSPAMTTPRIGAAIRAGEEPVRVFAERHGPMPGSPPSAPPWNETARNQENQPGSAKSGTINASQSPVPGPIITIDPESDQFLRVSNCTSLVIL